MATGFPLAFFRKPMTTELPLGSLLYRSRTTVKASTLDRAHSWTGIALELAESMARRLTLPPVRLPHLPGTDPVEAARLTRSELGLAPDTPVRNLLNALERAGVIVLVMPFGMEGVDGFCFWSSAGPAVRRPMIVIPPSILGDRLRLSVAHEVDHLVQHFPLVGSLPDAERDAYRFAAELLTPEVAMRREIRAPVTLTSLAPLKPRWGVSIQMLIRRSRDLGVVDDRSYAQLNQQLSARGWKLREPEQLAVPVEKPRALRKMAELLYGSPLGSGEIARLASDECLPRRFLETLFDAYSTPAGALSKASQDEEAADRVVPFRIPQKHSLA
ncbi:MAG: ImmA/IrrE family metallo-endopeptidase [Chloroflexota bacterium]|nr:ImmA/IrrE family metallo-endopeptidase [Chloroflexota bacterium]